MTSPEKSPTCLIIGAGGFLGAAIETESVRRGLRTIAVTRANYADHIGTECDLLINANGNSKKFLDARSPLDGFDLSVRSVLQSCLDFKARHYVLLSSGALYPDETHPDNNREDTPLSLSAMTTEYGFHKWLAEQIVRRHADSYTLFRLGGFVGPKLAKNAVYDVLGGHPLRVHPDSQFQFMDTRDLARLIFDIVDLQSTSQEVFNLSSIGTVSVSEISAWSGCTILDIDPDLPHVRAELNVEKVSQLVKLPTTAETIRAFIRDYQAGKIDLA